MKSLLVPVTTVPVLTSVYLDACQCLQGQWIPLTSWTLWGHREITWFTRCSILITGNTGIVLLAQNACLWVGVSCVASHWGEITILGAVPVSSEYTSRKIWAWMLWAALCIGILACINPFYGPRGFVFVCGFFCWRLRIFKVSCLFICLLACVFIVSLG